jgi:hypothetical protein
MALIHIFTPSRTAVPSLIARTVDPTMTRPGKKLNGEAAMTVRREGGV